MNKKIFILSIIMLTLISSVTAYDFSVSSSSEHTIYYNINTDGITVTVTYPGTSELTCWDGYTKPSGNLVIPYSVTYLGNTYIVSAISDNAFYFCSDLTSIIIEGNITSIGSHAFHGCSGLSTITLPEGITDMNSCIFYGCSSLNSIIIPNTVNTIEYAAFEGCSSLSAINIPAGVTSIGSYAFKDCSSLTNVIIPDNVNQIGAWAFSYCSSLSHVTIGNSVTTIGIDAFRDCGGLNSIIIGKNVASIGSSAFQSCNSLTNITSHAMIAPTLGSSVFVSVPASATVLVPCGTISSYSSTWTRFSNFVEQFDFDFSASSANVEMGSVNVDTEPTCQIPAVVSAIPNEGFNFGYWSDGNTDNPRTLIVTHDTTLIAYFIGSFNVVANNAMGGGIYPQGSTAVIFALPQVDLQFAGWDDGETANPRYVAVTSDTMLTALFRAPDTVRVYDTTTVYDTVINIVYDTVINIVYDTTEYNHYYYDTTRVYDTMVYVNIDTLHYYQYDTTYIIDTLVFYDTTSETHYVFDSTWVYDSVWVFDSVYITDTVYFFDTVYIEVPVQGIDGVEMVNVKVYTHHNRITVEGAEGMAVRLYDVNGRLLATKIEDAATTHFYVQASGTYLVRVGDLPARRVVVIM